MFVSVRRGYWRRQSEASVVLWMSLHLEGRLHTEGSSWWKEQKLCSSRDWCLIPGSFPPSNWANYFTSLSPSFINNKTRVTPSIYHTGIDVENWERVPLTWCRAFSRHLVKIDTPFSHQMKLHVTFERISCFNSKDWPLQGREGFLTFHSPSALLGLPCFRTIWNTNSRLPGC